MYDGIWRERLGSPGYPPCRPPRRWGRYFLMWFQKRFNFYQLLLDQARMSEEGMKLLCDFVRTPSEATGDAVKTAEKEADELRRHLIDAINRTLVTPFDREDIFALS